MMVSLASWTRGLFSSVMEENPPLLLENALLLEWLRSPATRSDWSGYFSQIYEYMIFPPHLPRAFKWVMSKNGTNVGLQSKKQINHHAFDPSHRIHPSCQITTQIARQVVDKPRLRIVIKKSSLYGHNKKQQQLVSVLFCKPEPNGQNNRQNLVLLTSLAVSGFLAAFLLTADTLSWPPL